MTGRLASRCEEMGAVRDPPHAHYRRTRAVVLTDQGQRLRLTFQERLNQQLGPLGSPGQP